ncbi:MFS transporter [Siccirubricoccus deserti]|uniref:MFS transporter n=1 Tax=Siccirubricoccus deserti TaxID=2013562 RepID=A0A9X0UFE2_9PROT|nr:MFS transporter [Siccirubricoccus deserti]MBC4014290.1 MFS transporter [Siccirubricoccus deserti]
MTGTVPMAQQLDAGMRRNLFLLACCQAIGQAGNTMMFSATALSVVTFYSNRDLATLPITLQHLGVMLAVFPAGLMMQRWGRRFGFRVGSVFGMLGGTTVSIGLYNASFPLMCLGGLILGYAVASLQMYRFAAVELVPSSHRAKAISWVTAGGVVAGIIGPALARWTHDQWMPLYLATYASMIGLHVIVFTIMSFIRFPPVPDSGGTTSTQGAPLPPPRPLREIAAQPRFIVAVISAMMAFGTMSFLMSASPLAIVGCGLPHTEAHWVIFLHVMGMFVPSFFTGNLIIRYGVTNIMFLGIVMLLAGVAAGLAGMTEWHFRIALTLNGVGWNFLFVGATTMVTTCYRPNERGKAQALNDFLVFGTTATASFLAGFLQERMGWVPLNWFSIVLLVIAVGAIGWLRLQRQPATATA